MDNAPTDAWGLAPSAPPPPPAWQATDALRFDWSMLGDEDADEAVAYDRADGMTHLMDSLALAVHRVLLAHPHGLPLGELTACVAQGDDPAALTPAQRRAHHVAMVGTREFALEQSAVERLLGTMASVGMVVAIPAHQG